MSTESEDVDSVRAELDRLSARLEEVLAVSAATADLLDRIGAHLEQEAGIGVAFRERAQAESARTSAILDFLLDREEAHTRTMRDQLDEQVVGLARQLDAVRRTDAYDLAWTVENPLVSIIIPTFHRPKELVEVAIPSALNQSHTNVEVIVVSDGPSASNRAATESVGDPRVRYLELAQHSPKPERRRNRWMVSGAAPVAFALPEVTGHWIALLGDDDEFEPDHIETLLALARQTRAEFAYGALRHRNLVTGQQVEVWSDPPALSNISGQSGLLHGSLAFFSTDDRSWLADEPEDWFRIRRMLAAGVRMAGTRRVIGTLNMIPWTHK